MRLPLSRVLFCALILLPFASASGGETGTPPGNPQQQAGNGIFDDAQQNLNQANELIDKYERRKRRRPLLDWILSLVNPAYRKEYRETKEMRDNIKRILESNMPPDQKAAALSQLNANFNTQISEFEQVLQRTPGRKDDPKKKDEWDRGVNEANEKDPDADSLQLGAQTKLGDGDFAGAAADASKAIAMGGGADSYATRAAANSGMGEYEAAVGDANQALQLDPKNQMAFQTLQMSQGRTKADAPAGAAQTAGLRQNQGFSTGQSRPNPLSNLRQPAPGAAASAEYAKRGQAALAMRDYASALAHLTRALELNPANAYALNLRAQAYAGMRRYGDSLKDAEAGLRLAPDDVPLLNAKAFAQNRLKDYRGAFATAQRALGLDPRSAYAYANLAHALGGMGDRQAMLENLRKAAALDPRYQSALEGLDITAPTEGDVMFLFPGEEGSGAPAKAAAPKTKPIRFGAIAFAALAGGFLIALGLLRVLVGPLSTLRYKLTHLGRRKAVDVPEPEYAPLPGEAERTPEPREMPPLVPPVPAKAGVKVIGGQYEIAREIGVGGMGIVYEAHDRSLDRKLAVKKMRAEIRDDARERERFLAEARTVAALRHPCIVEIFSILEEDGEVYLLFEFVKGETIFDINRKGLMPLPQALKYYRDIASALDHAHAHRVVHRDLKPSNVMVDEDDRARVMDFGVARVAKEAATRIAMTQTVMGTPPYMSPEQEQGVVGPQVDVYAMGICLYESLSGRLPFVGTGAGLLMNKMAMSYRPVTDLVPALPKGIDAVFAKAFQVDMSRRYAAAGDLIRDLEALAGARQA